MFVFENVVVGSRVQGWIEGMLVDWFSDIVRSFLSWIENVIFNYEGVGGYALTAYNVMVVLGGILLVTLALGKIIIQLMKETEGSTQADIWFTIIQGIKGSAMVLVTPAIVAFVMNSIVQPISSHFLGLVAEINDETLERLFDLENGEMLGAFQGTIVIILLWLFLGVVFGFFVFKVSLSMANVLFLEILSVPASISMLTESFNYIEDWWKDLLMHAVTIITLTISIVLFAEALTTDFGDVWLQIPAIVGTGAMVIAGPTVLKNIWYKSGLGRTGSGLAMKMLMLKK